MKSQLLVSFLVAIMVTKTIRTCEQSVLDLILIIDSSDSINAQDFNLTKNSVISMISNLDINPNKVKVGIINYSSQVQAIAQLVDSEQVKNNLIQKVKYMPHLKLMTATGDALTMANGIFTKFSRSLAPKVCVLFTDGYSNTGTNVYTAANTLKSSRVSLFSIGVGQSINKNELESISEKPASMYVKYVSNYQAMYSAINEITKKACGVPAYIEKNVKATVSSQRSEVKNFQFDLSSLNINRLLFVDIELTNLKGNTDLQVSWLNSQKSTITEATLIRKTERINVDNSKTVYYFFQVPPNSERMYMKTIGLENQNTYELLVSSL